MISCEFMYMITYYNVFHVCCHCFSVMILNTLHFFLLFRFPHVICYFHCLLLYRFMFTFFILFWIITDSISYWFLWIFSVVVKFISSYLQTFLFNLSSVSFPNIPINVNMFGYNHFTILLTILLCDVSF